MTDRNLNKLNQGRGRTSHQREPHTHGKGVMYR
jgi:hypothetical protein